MDIEKLGSGCIGVIRCINLAFCQFKQKPGVDGSQAEIVVSFCLFYFLHILLKPYKLRCRKIRGKMHSCLLADDLCHTAVFLLFTVRVDHHVCFDTLTDLGSSRALPYNGRCQRCRSSGVTAENNDIFIGLLKVRHKLLYGLESYS